MLKRIRKLSELSTGEWLYLSASVIMLSFAGMCLHCFGYRRTRTIMQYRVSGSDNQRAVDGSVLKQIQVISRMVGIAARHGPYRADCLSRSLVLHWLLAQAGIPAEIKFGIPVQGPDQSMEKFTAHAWVEYSSINLTDPGKGRQCAVFTGQ